MFMFALTLYREARGEPWEGKLAVAGVILNRVKDPRWPSTIVDVVLQRKQFSCYNVSDPQIGLYPKPKDAMWAECVKAVETALDSKEDFAKAANHYCTLNIRPDWSIGEIPVLVVGNHKFFAL